jgi:hypothetical protein
MISNATTQHCAQSRWMTIVDKYSSPSFDHDSWSCGGRCTWREVGKQLATVDRWLWRIFTLSSMFTIPVVANSCSFSKTHIIYVRLFYQSRIFRLGPTWGSVENFRYCVKNHQYWVPETWIEGTNLPGTVEPLVEYSYRASSWKYVPKTRIFYLFHHSFN